MSPVTTPLNLCDSPEQEDTDEAEGENLAKEDKTIPPTTRTNRLIHRGPGAKKRDTGESYIARLASSIDLPARPTGEPRRGKTKTVWGRVKEMTVGHASP